MLIKIQHTNGKLVEELHIPEGSSKDSARNALLSYIEAEDNELEVVSLKIKCLKLEEGPSASYFVATVRNIKNERRHGESEHSNRRRQRD